MLGEVDDQLGDPLFGVQVTGSVLGNFAINKAGDTNQGSMTIDVAKGGKFVTYKVMLDSQADKVALALEAADKAITKAETATEKRFDSVNEFRATLADQSDAMLRKSEYRTNHDALIATVKALGEKLQSGIDRNREDVADLETKVSALGKVEGRVATVEKKTDEQDTRLDLLHGKAAGVSSSVALMLAVGGVALAIVFFLVAHH